MTELEIGDITLRSEGPCLRVTIAEQQATALWSVDGVALAVDFLLPWLVAQTPPDRVHAMLTAQLEAALRKGQP